MLFTDKKRLAPHVQSHNSHAKSFASALALFHKASTRVTAYADFLQKYEVNPKHIVTESDFKKLPKINKENYFSNYSPAELSWDNSFTSSQYISTSSGSSGKPFFWPRGEIHDHVAADVFQNIFEDILGSQKGSTLCIISLAFGQWIAGFEFYNAICRTRDRGNKITLVTSGIEATDVINKMKNLAHMYDRVVIAGYPPFLKDIVEHGISEGITWSDHDVHLIPAGEPFTEKWREHVLKLLGKEKSIHGIVNVYGMSECGIVAHETAQSVLLRHNFETGALLGVPSIENITCLYQYYPTKRFIEIEEDSSILLTSDADFPLVRYETRDMGGTFELGDISKNNQERISDLAKASNIDFDKWQLPFVYLLGRKDFSVTLYGLNIYTDNIKMSLDTDELSDTLSGLFIMEVVEDEQLNQRLTITIELEKNKTSSEELSQTIVSALIAGLRTYNSEYSKLYSSLGERTYPHVVLVAYGALDTVRGRKHKWVKRN